MRSSQHLYQQVTQRFRHFMHIWLVICVQMRQFPLDTVAFLQFRFLR